MARDRQRSKQRQAERRARRLEQQGVPQGRCDGADIPGVHARACVGARRWTRPAPASTPTTSRPELPPEELGRSDFSLEHEARRSGRPCGSQRGRPRRRRWAARLAEEEEAYERDRGLGGRGQGFARLRQGLRRRRHGRRPGTDRQGRVRLCGQGPSRPRGPRGAQGPPACRTVPERGVGRASAGPVARPQGDAHAHGRRPRLRTGRGRVPRACWMRSSPS